MATKIENLFVGRSSLCSHPGKLYSADKDVYIEPSLGAQKPIRILYLCSDSASKIESVVTNGALRYVAGLLKTLRQNIADIPSVPIEEHEKESLRNAYKAGGTRALKAMLNVAEEEHAIQMACDSSKYAHLEKFVNVRVSEVTKRIKDNEPDVFHFSGHLKKSKGLVFCRARQDDHTIDAGNIMNEESLVECFGKKKVKLAIIASCNSASFAQALVAAEVAEMAIGSKNSIDDVETVTFVNTFYRELTKLMEIQGQALQVCIQKAFSSAVKAVMPLKCHMCIYPEADIVPKVCKSMENAMGDAIVSAENSLAMVDVKDGNEYK